MSSFKANYKYFLGITALYIALIFILPANHVTKTAYNLTDTQYRFLLLLVQLPIMLVWQAAYYGYKSLSSYTKLISDTPEGKDYASMSNAMAWIAWGLPVPAVIGLVLNATASIHHNLLSTALIIVNYLYVIVSIMAFHYFSKGSGMLAERSKIYFNMQSGKRMIALFVLIGVLFCYLMFAKLHGGTSLTDSYNAFYLPNWLVGVTIMIPYLYAWFIGLLAAYELLQLSKGVSGVLYKRALRLLASGLIIIIVSLVALQYFRAIVPRVGHLKISGALIFTYSVYAASALGYLLLAAGARRLKKIEEV